VKIAELCEMLISAAKFFCSLNLEKTSEAGRDKKYFYKKYLKYFKLPILRTTI
jgi:hypothetical protein